VKPKHKSKAGHKCKATDKLSALEVDVGIRDCCDISAGGVSFSPLFSSGPNTTVDDDGLGNDDSTKATEYTTDTVYCETHHEIIKQLDQESIKNNKGDLGLLDEEGDGYEVVQSFCEGMIDTEQERYDDVECDDNTAFACERTDNMNTEECSLFGAPRGWMPRQPSKDGMPTMKINKGEPLCNTMDNPGSWSSYTYCPVFGSTKGGEYQHHSMPAGATVVPINSDTRKREHGGYKFLIMVGHIQIQMHQIIDTVQPEKIYSPLTGMFNWMHSI
jgi:hypothetical protein